MSCGCSSGSGYDGGIYGGVCDADIPYPSVSHESVPSLIDNLVYALYGVIEKDVTSGKVVWNIPCDPSNIPATINGIPRNDGEGLLCYIVRALNLTTETAGFVTVNGVQTLTNKILDATCSLLGNATTATRATNIAGGVAGSLPYQTGVGTTVLLPQGTAGQVLSTNGSGELGWITNSATSSSTNNINGGTAGVVVYQTGVNTTGFTAAGTSGQVLTSNGTSAPTWSTNIAGNAGTATQLQTSRTLGISGDVTGTASFNGSANATISATIANGVVTAAKLGTNEQKQIAKAWVNFDGRGTTYVSSAYTRSGTTVTVTQAGHNLSTGNPITVFTATDSGLVANQISATFISSSQFSFQTSSTGATSGTLGWNSYNIRSSYNVSSITKNGTGDYTVNFAAALADANYSAVVTGQGDGSINTIGLIRSSASYNSLTASTARVTFINTVPVPVDPVACCVTILGN
jgi:hypothetical protein